MRATVRIGGGHGREEEEEACLFPEDQGVWLKRVIL
jgi:hypothetical protein